METVRRWEGEESQEVEVQGGHPATRPWSRVRWGVVWQSMVWNHSYFLVWYGVVSYDMMWCGIV